MKCVPWKTMQEKHTYTSVSNPFYKCTYLPCLLRPTHAAVLHQHHSFRVVLQPTASGGNIWPFCSWVLHCVHQLVTICFCDFHFSWKQLKKWWMMELKQSRKAVSETLNSAESYAKLSPLCIVLHNTMKPQNLCCVCSWLDHNKLYYAECHWLTHWPCFHHWSAKYITGLVLPLCKCMGSLPVFMFQVLSAFSFFIHFFLIYYYITTICYFKSA